MPLSLLKLVLVAGAAALIGVATPSLGQTRPPHAGVPGHRKVRSPPPSAPPPPLPGSTLPLAPLLPTPPPGRVSHHSHLVPLPYPGLLLPQPVVPYPSGFVMTFTKSGRAASGPDALTPVEIRPQQVPQRLALCWAVPELPTDDAEITVRLAFSRTGAIVGQPRITYVKAGTGADATQALVQSMRSALGKCAPLPFTASLGSAIAGYPFAIRFIASGR